MIHPKHKCKDCGGDGFGPIIKNSLWNLITKGSATEHRILLCWWCIEKRLGRELELEDLKEYPFNSNIVFIWNRMINR